MKNGKLALIVIGVIVVLGVISLVVMGFVKKEDYVVDVVSTPSARGVLVGNSFSSFGPYPGIGCSPPISISARTCTGVGPDGRRTIRYGNYTFYDYGFGTPLHPANWAKTIPFQQGIDFNEGLYAPRCGEEC